MGANPLQTSFALPKSSGSVPQSPDASVSLDASVPLDGSGTLEAPYWTKVQYLYHFSSHKFHIICPDRSLSSEQSSESIDRGSLLGDPEVTYPLN
jgi:hypothetical protein